MKLPIHPQSTATLVFRSIMESLNAKYLLAKEEITVKVILSPLIGISLNMYNKEPWYHQEQEFTNEAVLELNRWMKFKNAKCELETPMLDRKVHKQQGNGRRPVHKYSKLFDELHLRGAIRRDWVRELVRVMQHNDQ